MFFIDKGKLPIMIGRNYLWEMGMKKLVLLVMLALCLITVSAPAWGADAGNDGIVFQGPPEPKDPPK
jgi:hypothetical protein